MKVGTISGNTAADGGGGVEVWNETATFTQKGGTIYGDTDTTHTPGSAENTAAEGGHAVQLNDGLVRNTTAGVEVKLYAKRVSNSWTYNGSSSGGVGDRRTGRIRNRKERKNNEPLTKAGERLIKNSGNAQDAGHVFQNKFLSKPTSGFIRGHS
jgi:hypothetical protein